MNELKSFKERLKILNDSSIIGYLLELFNFQVNNNPVYRKYVKAIGINARSVVKSGR